MSSQFCSQCSKNLQSDFKFCPYCGQTLACASKEFGHFSSLTISVNERKTSGQKSPGSSRNLESLNHNASVSHRPGLRSSCGSLPVEKAVQFNTVTIQSNLDATTQLNKDGNNKVNPGSGLSLRELEPVPNTSKAEDTTGSLSPIIMRSPRMARGRAKPSDSTEEQNKESSSAEEQIGGSCAAEEQKGRPKAKRAKLWSTVDPLQEGEEVTDTTGKKWKLLKLLSQNTTELLYEVSRPSNKDSNYTLKLGSKDGKLFSEQNFLQRAAKPAHVEKWIKQNKLDFLGIPICAGFGIHSDCYRFIVFPDLGHSLRSVIEEENNILPEKFVLTVACRLLDILKFIHTNQYVHGDINAENIRVKPGQTSQVYLVGYSRAFRYCPEGKHVEYRRASRTPHEGAIEFISLDSHNGAAPSRRSDLQSLGYCMLRWLTGRLPWSDLTQPSQVATQKRRYMEDTKAFFNDCLGRRKISNAFQTYITTVMALQYMEEPDYPALNTGLSDALHQLGGLVELPLNL